MCWHIPRYVVARLVNTSRKPEPLGNLWLSQMCTLPCRGCVWWISYRCVYIRRRSRIFGHFLFYHSVHFGEFNSANGHHPIALTQKTTGIITEKTYNINLFFFFLFKLRQVISNVICVLFTCIHNIWNQCYCTNYSPTVPFAIPVETLYFQELADIERALHVLGVEHPSPHVPHRTLTGKSSLSAADHRWSVMYSHQHNECSFLFPSLELYIIIYMYMLNSFTFLSIIHTY